LVLAVPIPAAVPAVAVPIAAAASAEVVEDPTAVEDPAEVVEVPTAADPAEVRLAAEEGVEAATVSQEQSQPRALMLTIRRRGN
jgi:hypothetical protein